MVTVIFYLFIMALGAYGLYHLVKLLGKKSDKCPKCGGKGYWIGVREKETCDWCKGTGILPGSGKYKF